MLTEQMLTPGNVLVEVLTQGEVARAVNCVTHLTRRLSVLIYLTQ